MSTATPNRHCLPPYTANDLLVYIVLTQEENPLGEVADTLHTLKDITRLARPRQRRTRYEKPRRDARTTHPGIRNLNPGPITPQSSNTPETLQQFVAPPVQNVRKQPEPASVKEKTRQAQHGHRRKHDLPGLRKETHRNDERHAEHDQ